jgi:hypothetical protein
MPESTGEIGYLKKNILQVISTDVDTIQEVSDYEKSGFRGFPAVTVTCSGNDNVFYSSAENERTFLFNIRVYEQLEAIPKNELTAVADNEKQRAEAIVERVVDQLLNAFDTTLRFTLSDSADNGIEAVPSRWGYALLPVGWCRTAEIELRIKKTLIVT